MFSTPAESTTRVVLIVAAVATIVALAAFAFVTDAPAYAGTASETCANCHVMDSMYENYYHGAHRAWAECADCHLPHGDAASYYVEKGRQGIHDVLVFTTGQTPPVIRLSAHSQAIIQDNCIRCHEQAVETMLMGQLPFEQHCWDCHRDIAHGPRGGSIVPLQDSNLYPLEQGE